jgi:hypothetical protein
MVLFDGLAQPRPHDVRINLRRRDIGMTQHGLDTAQVRPTFEKMGGEAVADHVWSQIMKDSSLFPVRRQ